MTANNTEFQLPFVINVRGMTILQVVALVDKLRNYYNAQFSHTADEFYGALSEDFDSAQDKAHERGPYIGVDNNRSSMPGLFSSRAVPEPCMVLTEAEIDEFEALGIKPKMGAWVTTPNLLNPGTSEYIVVKKLGQIYGYAEKEYRVMANSPADADRRCNALGWTLSVKPVNQPC
ncbi:MAG TPA: hypothetical protein DCF82_17765 [Marinobacter hydrocarbonoclasticus]|uniref:Uncharacterized protein n=1 Tax=Marinobacter nauticus TaxID=2743 RepID=A0A3B8WMA3_MARNT|nr:hypothetical protein [Marinobacter nauticus]